MKSFLKNIITSILTFESRIILKKYHPTIIAVTGNVGKTSTKDAIYTVLSPSCHVRKSEKSFNSEIGVPLTILGVQNAWNDPIHWIQNIIDGIDLIFFKHKYPECLVLEVGADHPNDIKKIAKWLKPDISVITKIGDVPVHIEFFPSVDSLVAEKAYLVKALKKNGVLILSADEEKVRNLSKGISQKNLTFGIKEKATVSASNIEILYSEDRSPEGMSFKLNFEGNSVPVRIKGMLGNQQIYPILAATAVGIARGILFSKIIEFLPKHTPSKGRMNILQGINDSIIIDDSYNSSPDALYEALSTFSTIETSGKKIAVLGDMMELGKYSVDEHRKAGIKAIQSCKVLITVGLRAKLMNGNINFESSNDALEYVKSIVEKGDIILIKGSQSVRMERIAKILLLDQNDASKLLVRQDPEWLAKG
jgi:UDP-N-acetylmuramoyl-tripeptide--D-alanyl-D-alanine ligase